ncbi:MAG: hypothetical protein C4532_09270 [Candidatus Abyssobacteria bacterium SURF_17]|uniref:Outer membrane protein beta-barrel domain-containing protein n=1 Tax=Candidatus Abyssobacteria bacterium SURF_17 TaxID=2093361 RepID=A0A419EYW7_9BACT|nr:MAG: hypothetical protein C4532_09270 [Candidatus Abyssubacteria bacterium SURF_17]
MREAMINVLIIVLLSGVSVSASNRPAGLRGIGPRVGFTINPDQIHLGGHLDLGDLSNNLMMMPNIEIGFGDDVTTVAPTFELDYRFRSDWGAWTPYLGGGVGPVFYSPDHGDSATELGLYLQFGIGKGSAASQSGHFFVEGKLGLADAPDFKATVGWTFGR